MDDLPELPFEQILSYLSLEDRLKSKAVSRRWYQMIDSFKVKSLCYSELPSGFINGKSRWVSGAFAQNFISSPQFKLFFNTFGQTILSNLKHLRLCNLLLNAESRKAFAPALNSFGQLEELDIIALGNIGYRLGIDLELPMLTSIHLEDVHALEYLNLETPRLLKVKHLRCSCPLDIVHGESVEKLYTHLDVPLELKNLKYIYSSEKIGATFLSGLKQLKEIHLDAHHTASELFNQKQRYGRSDLKIFLFGLLLNGPEDPAIDPLFGFNEEALVYLAENLSRLADEIPLYRPLSYAAIERVAPELAINVLNRFTGMDRINVYGPVRDIQRFLDFLKNFENITHLFFGCAQPQDLFDRLPDHCAIQWLLIGCTVSDLAFLLRLKDVFEIYVFCEIDLEFVRKVFEELKFLWSFEFKFLNRRVSIKIIRLKKIEVFVVGEKAVVPDLDAAIQFIVENVTEDE